MVKRILLGTVATAIIASASQASTGSGFYMGAGLGQSYGRISNKTISRAFDELEGVHQSYDFGERKLKGNNKFAGKLITGYEHDLTDCSLLFEAGYLVDTSKSKYDKKMELSNIDDADGNEPTITSMKLQRGRTFSLGLGVKKGVSNKVSMMSGLDVLNSQFKYQATATGSYTSGFDGVSRKKSKFGLAPWVGISYDMDIVEAGLRYQYAKYQRLKVNGEFSTSKFSINNKIKPEYHTIMLTLSKKINII